MKRIGRLAGLAAIALITSGCVLLGDKADQFRWNLMTLPIYVFDNVAGYKNPQQTPVMEDRVNLAVAISGGGTRSAVFSAGVLEQLAYLPDPRHPGRTILDGVDVISAVSGGSLSAAYYSLYKPADFANQDANQKFFSQFKSNMTTDFQFRGTAHYLTHPWEAVSKYYTRYRFVQTLGETFDQHIFKGANFNSLLERELHGEAPVTILNSVSLDTGKKFLFTNLNVQQNFTYNPVELISSLNKLAPSNDLAGLTMLAQAGATPVFQPFGFDSINSDVGQFRLAHAVAASSAYPVIPGPATLMNYATPGYVHLADGGINDNSGVDNIVGLYLAKLAHAKRREKVVILSINVAPALKPKEEQDPDGYVSSIEYADRAATTLATRAQVLSSVMCNLPGGSIQVINISFPDATNTQQFDSSLAMYAISERDATTVLNASAELVQRNHDRILQALASR